MPNFDTGSLFLTFLAPVKPGTTTDLRGEEVSYQRNLRNVLAFLPTALQSPATQEIGINSPFALNRRTHLARFVVIDEAPFNGRMPQDPIVGSLKDEDPITPRKVDKLTTPFLFFGAEIDAVTEDGAPLPTELDEDAQTRVRDAYARELWATMEPELRSIYANCFGFESVKTADDFARYLARCQVETTMPFHDYWIDPPALKPLNLKILIALVAIPAVVALLGLLGLLTGMDSTPILGWFTSWTPGITTIVALILTVVAAVGAYRFVLGRGAQPFPPQPGASLPNVLKSLYVQQHFSDFVTAQQGAEAQDLHKAFGAFLDTHKPDDIHGPTQTPGVISVRAPGGTTG